jgi:hypothetical protein
MQLSEEEYMSKEYEFVTKYVLTNFKLDRKHEISLNSCISIAIEAHVDICQRLGVVVE